MENLESSEDEQDENAIVDASISGLPLKDVDKLDAGCSCLRKCLDKLERQNLIEHIQNIRELSKSEKDMYIMGAIKVNGSTAKKSHEDIKRHRFSYCFNGVDICVAAFRIIYDISEDMLKAIAKHVVSKGITPRIHGNTGKKAPNAFAFEEYQRVKTFIMTYADDYGLPQPAAPRGRDEDPPVYLPASHTKKHVYEIYKNASPDKFVGKSSFYDLWKKLLPHIKISTPKDDACFKCESHRKAVEDARSEEDKLEATRAYLTHIEEARREREVYKTCVQESKEELLGYVCPNRPVQHQTSNLTKMHYTFDFAQSLILPHHARQIGQIYFTTPRKMHLFGVRLDGLSMQMNYMIDEDETIGILSLFHNAYNL